MPSPPFWWCPLSLTFLHLYHHLHKCPNSHQHLQLPSQTLSSHVPGRLRGSAIPSSGLATIGGSFDPSQSAKRPPVSTMMFNAEQAILFFYALLPSLLYTASRRHPHRHVHSVARPALASSLRAYLSLGAVGVRQYPSPAFVCSIPCLIKVIHSQYLRRSGSSAWRPCTHGFR